MRVTLFGAVLWLMAIPAARGDYLDWRLDLSCDVQGGRVEIGAHGVYNQGVLGPQTRDCTLSTRRTVRAKIGFGPVLPYGFGRGTPAKWVTVWIDKALVLSREEFGCGDEGPCNLRVTVTSNGMKVCDLVESEDGSAAEFVEECEVTPNAELPTERDVLEFPGPGDPQPPPAGSVETLFARDREFCSRFPQTTGELDLPSDAELIEPLRSWDYEFAGQYGRYDVDINNDGSAETVVGLHSRTHYRDGDIYFVYTDGVVPEPEIARHASSELAYARTADRILPHYWVDSAGIAEKQFAQYDRNNSNYEAKSAKAPWWDEDDRPIFSLRYLYLRPFRYGDSTYFLTSSLTGHWYMVLRPEPDFQATEMCIFQIVQERY